MLISAASRARLCTLKLAALRRSMHGKFMQEVPIVVEYKTKSRGIFMNSEQDENVLSAAAVSRLRRELSSHNKAFNIHAVFLKGMGDWYCSGSDVREMYIPVYRNKTNEISYEFNFPYFWDIFDLAFTVRTVGAPLVCCLNGKIRDGGMSLALGKYRIQSIKKHYSRYSGKQFDESVNVRFLNPRRYMWPDCGALYEMMCHSPQLGKAMALTGFPITNLKRFGLASHFMYNSNHTQGSSLRDFDNMFDCHLHLDEIQFNNTDGNVILSVTENKRRNLESFLENCDVLASEMLLPAVDTDPHYATFHDNVMYVNKATSHPGHYLDAYSSEQRDFGYLPQNIFADEIDALPSLGLHSKWKTLGENETEYEVQVEDYVIERCFCKKSMVEIIAELKTVFHEEDAVLKNQRSDDRKAFVARCMRGILQIPNTEVANLIVAYGEVFNSPPAHEETCPFGVTFGEALTLDLRAVTYLGNRFKNEMSSIYKNSGFPKAPKIDTTASVEKSLEELYGKDVGRSRDETKRAMDILTTPLADGHDYIHT